MKPMTKNRIKQKYACPPLGVSVLKKHLGILTRTFSKHFPLTDRIERERQPLFIISSGRSGTTLMRSMLVAGGQVAIPGETQVLQSLPIKWKALQGLGWQDLCRLMIAEFDSHPNFKMWEINLAPTYEKVLCLPENERSLARVVDEVFMAYAAEKFPEARLWGDQSPINTFFLPYVQHVFPKGRFIHMLRDGRDVISSMVERHGAGHLDEAIYRWTESIRRTDAFQKKVPADQYLEVRYEKLVQAPEETLQGICCFLKIDYQPQMLDYYKLPTTMEHKYKSFHKNLGKPVFASSVGKWRERLTPDQQQIVLQAITPTLQHLGYLE